MTDYVDADEEELPVGLYLEESVEEGEREDAEAELDGALWFISLLTRVDGAVLMTPNLEVMGFGVEIRADDTPSAVWAAGNASGAPSRRRKADYYALGTRHRSMMRYCWTIPGSLGLVISQDGDVRAMLRLDDSLAMWEQIQLQRSW
jgi:hypothetical protein